MIFVYSKLFKYMINFNLNLDVPSGELTFCNGKSPFFMGKSTISMAIYTIAKC